MKKRLIVFISACLLATPCVADSWTGATGDFSDAANWDSGEVPEFAEALINNGGVAQLAGEAVLTELRIGLDGGSGEFQQSSGSLLDATGAFIGDNSQGSVVISGGDFMIGNDSIHVGWRPGGVGMMTIDGADAIVTSGDDFQLGREGTGTLDFRNGFLSAGYTVIGKFGTGIWNQTGGMFDQAFGDVEIGDGGRDDQAGTSGPRLGTMNISGGFMQVDGDLAIGNRRGGGEVNVSGGMIAVTGKENGNIYIGRGADSSPGVGLDTSLRISGAASTIVANGSLLMNLEEVSASSTLIAELTGPDHSTILLGGGADITNGTLKVDLNGYVPTANDSWVLLETGVDLENVLEAIDDVVDGAGYEPLEHAFAVEPGEVSGPFAAIDMTDAVLPAGLSWDVQYTGESVILSIAGVAGTLGDFDGNGTIDATDIDLLSAEVRAGTNDPQYDVNSDGLVNDQDRSQWVDSLKSTYVGDSNLDGQFDSGDLVAVFTVGEYEDGVAGNSGWADGDWNGDGDFDTTDFVAAFSAGGYEQGPRPALAAAVPEPNTLSLLFAGLIGLRIAIARRV